MYKKNLVFVAAYIGMLIFGIAMISVGSLLPNLTDKFSLTGYSAGALVSLLPSGILLGSLVFGPIVDRYGYKILLIICSLFVVLGIYGIAISDSMPVLQISILLIGFGGGVINGGTNALVADIAGDEKGAKLSFLGVFYGIGALGVPAVLGILSGYFTYQNILITISIFLLLLISFLFFVKFPAPKQSQGFPIKEGIKLVNDPVLLLFGFFLFFQSGIEGIGNNWTTTYLQKYVMASPENSLFALTYLVIALTGTRLILSFILKGLSRSYVIYMSLIIVMLGSLIIFAGGTYFYTVTGLVFLGIGFAAGFPVILSFVADIFSGLSGTAFSLVFVIALFGNMVLNYITGIVSETYGIRYFTLMILFSAVIMALILWYLLKRTNLNNKKIT
ncbi:MAG: sugar MFS transporter [Ignavibacteriaceae bacterium]